MFNKKELLFIKKLIKNDWILKEVENTMYFMNTGIDSAFYYSIGRLEAIMDCEFNLTEFNDDKEEAFFDIILTKFPQLEW